MITASLRQPPRAIADDFRVDLSQPMNLAALGAARDKCEAAIKRTAEFIRNIRPFIAELDAARAPGGRLLHSREYVRAQLLLKEQKQRLDGLQRTLGEINRRIRAERRRGAPVECLFVATAKAMLPQETYQAIWLEVHRRHPEAF